MTESTIFNHEGLAAPLIYFTNHQLVNDKAVCRAAPGFGLVC